MKVFLDDVRETPPGWERTYTAAETIALLETGTVTHLSLDHDLGDDDVYGTGYDVLLWIEEAVACGFEPPARMDVHSSNWGARPKMQAAIAVIQRMARR